MLDCPTVRPSTLIVGSALLGLLAQIPLGMRTARADGVATRSDVIAVKDIKKGMKGYGLTVFEGTKPEKFDVEVIDVLYNFRPRQELILVKTTHPRLEVAKVVAGMSGSPIYLGGKMAGAYAYGWAFGKEPVAGVTPIRSMLDDLARPVPKQINGWPLKILPQKGKKHAKAFVNKRNRYAGNLGDYDLGKHAEQIKKARGTVGTAKGSPVVPVATPLLMGGMTPTSIGFAEELFEPMGLVPLQAGGGGKTDPNAPKRYVDGGAVGVQLIRGDMSAMGMGTVTRVEGDKLVGFGHPMMYSGVTAMPTAIGRVLWFLASDMRSFKIGMAARPVGALVNDRLASIVVSHSAQAPVVPVNMRVRGVAGGAPHEVELRGRPRKVHDSGVRRGRPGQRSPGDGGGASGRELEREEQAQDQGPRRDQLQGLRRVHRRHAERPGLHPVEPRPRHGRAAQQPLEPGDRRERRGRGGAPVRPRDLPAAAAPRSSSVRSRRDSRRVSGSRWCPTRARRSTR